MALLGNLKLKDQRHGGYTIGWSYGSWSCASSGLLLYGISFGILNMQ